MEIKFTFIKRQRVYALGGAALKAFGRRAGRFYTWERCTGSTARPAFSRPVSFLPNHPLYPQTLIYCDSYTVKALVWCWKNCGFYKQWTCEVMQRWRCSAIFIFILFFPFLRAKVSWQEGGGVAKLWPYWHIYYDHHSSSSSHLLGWKQTTTL